MSSSFTSEIGETMSQVRSDPKWFFSLDEEPPTDPSVAKAYWCEMDRFLAHTATGGHPPCRCPVGMGHNDPDAPGAGA